MEDNLQQYIYDNPESIPLYEIKEDIRLLILAREFATKSGPIDAIGTDKDGEIYLVETKFYKNPKNRNQNKEGEPRIFFFFLRLPAFKISDESKKKKEG